MCYNKSKYKLVVLSMTKLQISYIWEFCVKKMALFLINVKGRSNRIDMIYHGIANVSAIGCFDNVKYLTAFVAEERKNRICKFLRDEDKIRSLTAELLLRHMLSVIYGTNASEIRFGVDKYGKPYLTGSKLKFNISHSGDYVACAVGDSEMGIDVEKISKEELPEVYNVFAPSEIEIINALPQNMQADLFYRIWTLKESYVKKTGDGLHRPFDSFSFDLTGDSICLKDSGKAGSENAFFNKKLDGRYWYSVCFPSYERIEGIIEYNIFRLIDAFR